MAALGYLTVIVVVVLQFLTATNWGFATGSSLHRSTVLEARLAVNFSNVPASEQQCYEMRILTARVRIDGSKEFPYIWSHLLRQLEEDQLSAFNSGQYQVYRTEGLPLNDVKRCSVPERPGPPTGQNDR